VATETELETMAAWLEREGFTLKKRRAVTMSYLALVFSTSSASHLRAICQRLQLEARAHEQSQLHRKPEARTPYSVNWLALRRTTQLQVNQAKAS
jgi:hypothetical protein